MLLIDANLGKLYKLMEAVLVQLLEHTDRHTDSHKVMLVPHTDILQTVMLDKEELQLEITALTAQHILKLTLDSQHVFQIHVQDIILFYSQMEPVDHVDLESKQIQLKEIVLLQEHTTDTTEMDIITQELIMTLDIPITLVLLFQQVQQLHQQLHQEHQL